ncbi:M1 family metallopeptidase [Montanilutibacter psychrotolerans]|uniref:Aminopeptidase n=1 Tax=Montanilutibacter psychrotolerans TaxID=1327343 RepID=A0A3M8STK5_9GAMM|nr:M1 family metallopeptidase [Lysobacter psychrotolerans]RNF82554.1 M1 family peptidase [Lysobacter psychrotolerans]
MHRYLVSAIALALASASFTVAAQPPSVSTAVQTTTQLPRNVRPVHYALEVVPHASSLTFDGKVAITLDVLEPTATITLNAVDIAFASARLAGAGVEASGIVPRILVDTQEQTATFIFDAPLATGRYVLAMDYRGKIGTQANGLFAIDYENRAGKQRALYTQFENSDARKFVPSWDEPNHKATFDLTATVPSAQMAVSNMPVTQTTELGDGTKRVRFAQSPRMSTYLLFFGLGDFERATLQAGDTEVGVIAQTGSVAQAQFALESSRDVLREYNDYFGVPYPLPKLDNIGSPGRSQFFGAMENWGAIYTFEYVLLLDPTIATQADRENVFSVAAHEIAHQWFGDLVTMSWWDDLWLNEGFASWLAGRTTEKLHPEWNTAVAAVDVRERAMRRDAVVTTHPVVQHVETVDQASQAFDSITYSKGEAVIRMLEGYVGAEAWRDGVRRYIKANAYGNTVSDDLWREVEAAAGKPVTAIAHDFTLQPGVPMIRVESARCEGDTTTLVLKQGEFTKDRPDKVPLRWRVPVIAQAIGSDSPVRAVISEGEGTMSLPGCAPVLVNAGQSGYYRTLYAPEQRAAIRDRFTQLRAVDQLGLMGDTWSLGLVELQPASDYLDLVRATPVDADPQIWGSVAGRLGELDDFYRDDATQQAAFRAFAIGQLAPVLARIGWDARPGEAGPVANLRNTLITALGALGDADVIAQARRRHAAADRDPAALPAALRTTVLGVVAQHADAATWEQLHAQAKVEKTPLVKDNLYALLSSTRDVALARRALALSLTDEPGATNSAAMIRTVSNQHPDLAFDFAVAHREQVDGMIDSASTSRFYPILATNSLDPAMVGKVRAYAQAHIVESSRRVSETAVANILYRVGVRERVLPVVSAWLSRRGSAARGDIAERAR